MTEPGFKELKKLGAEFPSSWVGAIIQIRTDPPAITAFCGMATLLGKNVFLTAGHVIKDALDGPDVASVVILDANSGKYRVAVIDKAEMYPDKGVDLAAGRFGQVSGTGELIVEPPFSAVGLAEGWTDVRSFGYPDELVHPTKVSDYRFAPVSLKGYVMRQLKPGDHFQVEYQALELNFPIPKGMSGAPIFAEEYGQRYLCGVATGTAEARVVRHRTISELKEGIPHLEERESRIVEVGVAVRLSHYLDWEIAICDGRKLGTLLLGGKIPEETQPS